MSWGAVALTVGAAVAYDQIGGEGAAADRFQPADFSSPGLTGQFDKKANTFDVTRSAQSDRTTSDLQSAFGQRGQEFRNLIPQTEKGFGALTRAGMNRFGDKRRRAIGNLRENLARRRVAGSSFAEDAASRAEAEFAREEETFRAQTALQEIDMATRLIDRATAAEISGFQTALNQLNFESELAANMSSEATSAIQKNTRLQTEVALAQSAARQELIGNVTGAWSQKLSSSGG